MNNDKLTLEEFRKIITDKYIEKGAEPPVPGGKKEQLLYGLWLKGKEKLQSLTKKWIKNG